MGGLATVFLYSRDFWKVMLAASSSLLLVALIKRVLTDVHDEWYPWRVRGCDYALLYSLGNAEEKDTGVPELMLSTTHPSPISVP